MQNSSGILWWQINASGIVGWTGELQGTSYWVEPVTGGTTGASATVNTSYLNVRNAPSAWASILTQVRRGETYTVIGRLADNRWLQLNVNGTIGWVNASYVIASNLSGVPVIVA